MTVETKVDWHLKGTVVLACNCDFGCPCNFNALPTKGDCEGGWTWHIDDGEFNGVRLDGLNFSMLADWPKAIHMGNGEAVMLIDERADDSQREAIQTLLSGSQGGPWSTLVNTISKTHGTHIVPYEVKLEGDRSSVRAGDTLQLDVEPVKNPVTGAEMHPRAVLPEGFIFKDAVLVSSRTFTVNDGVGYDHSGKYAAVAPFEYASAP